MLCLILHLNVVSFPTAGKHAGTANKHCMLEFKSYYLVFVSVVSVIVVVQQSSSNL